MKKFKIVSGLAVAILLLHQSPPSDGSDVIQVPLFSTPLTNWSAWGAGGAGLKGDQNFGQSVVPNISGNVMEVEAGGLHNVALRADGTVFCWGRNIENQCDVPAGLIRVKQIGAGFLYSMALRNDGSVVHWGTGIYGMRPVPAAVTNIVAIAAGSSHCLALRADGKVLAWGWNGWGQTNVPGTLDNVIAISAGDALSAALRADGTVEAWGSGPQPPKGLNSVVQISCGSAHMIALRADGTVVSWGMDSARGATNQPSGLTNIIQVAAGLGFSLALKSDGTVIGWGRGETSAPNYYGQTTIPVNLQKVRRISAGNFHSLAEQANPTSAMVTDSDGDGASDYVEAVRLRTNVTISDSDGDGYPDGLELALMKSPLIASEHPSVPWIDPIFSNFSDEGFRLKNISPADRSNVVVEISADLAHWERLLILPGAPHAVEIIDPSATRSANRYYRTRLE